MFKQDELILRAYFRLEESRRQRLWMQRVWHPETMDWKKRGGPPPMTETKRIRQEELARLGFGESHYGAMGEAETAARATLEGLAREHPLWEHFSKLHLFGPYLCGCFVAAGGDIQRPPTVSAFWRGMGLDLVVVGDVAMAPRRLRANVPVNKALRDALGDRIIPALPHVTLIGEQIRSQILRGSGNLYQRYLQFKELEPPDKIKMFRHKSALRKTQKVLYACAWREWRQAYGLPAPDPYAFAILKHGGDGGPIRFSDLYDTPVPPD